MDRVLVNTATTLSTTFYVGETAGDADGAVTVTVTAADGTVIATGAATTKTATGTYTYTLAGRTAPDVVTLVWSGLFSTKARSQTTTCEVVGDTYFGLAELRTWMPELSNATDYPTSRLVAARDRAEVRLEECLGRSFVSRCAIETFYAAGRADVRLRWPNVTSIRQATVNGTAVDAAHYELHHGVLAPRLRNLGGWGTDDDDVTRVVYVHGAGAVPDDVKWAAMRLAVAYTQRSAIPDRAERWNLGQGGTDMFSLAMPGSGRVGIPEVDAIIADRRLPVLA